MKDKDKQILTMAEAADYLGYGHFYFYRLYPKLVKRGLKLLRASKKGSVRFLKDNLIEVMEKIGKGSV